MGQGEFKERPQEGLRLGGKVLLKSLSVHFANFLPAGNLLFLSSFFSWDGMGEVEGEEGRHLLLPNS